jgi:uncharacterized protein involved in type VI secretion and phage assembly
MKALTPLQRLVAELDGAPLSGDEARALGEVRVQQRLSLPALCELSFENPPVAFAERAHALPGAGLRLGVEGRPQGLFAGEITAATLEYGPAGALTVRVRAYDRLHRLRKRQPLRRHAQLSAAALVQEVVADLGLRVEAEQPGPRRDAVLQHRHSDFELIAEGAERAGLYFTLRGDTLHLLTLEGIGSPVPIRLGDNLLEARFEVNGERACRAVDVLGWDPWAAEPRRGGAREPRAGRRTEAEVAPERLGGTGALVLTNQALQSEEQAEALAQAELDRRSAGEVTLQGTLEGDPDLRPGTPVVVAGVATALAGRYVLTAVTHRVDREHGFLSDVETAPPVPRACPVGNHATVGVVTEVADPEGLGRVRVSLPGLGDLESDWLEVVSPAAGPGKGLVALPDAGDRVLVAFVGNDPAQGVVLGGLYGVTPPPDPGVDGGRVRRFTLVTSGGQGIRLDDGAERVRVENHQGRCLELSPGRARLQDGRGSFVELGGEEVGLHAATDLVIEAPGRAITLRAARIDFEQA